MLSCTSASVLLLLLHQETNETKKRKNWHMIKEKKHDAGHRAAGTRLAGVSVEMAMCALRGKLKGMLLYGGVGGGANNRPMSVR
jgi:L-alanine-DL-glutamate epimerase-like enolase superfamily enzyme